MSQAKYDFNGRILRRGDTVRLRQGVYGGYYAEVLDPGNGRVEVRLFGVEMPATFRLDSRSMEVTNIDRGDSR